MDMSGGGAAGHARRSAVPPSVVSQRSERKVPYRVILVAIWLTLASLAAVWLLYRWKHLIFYLVMAGFIALVLNRPIQTLQRWRLSRGPAILAVSVACGGGDGSASNGGSSSSSSPAPTSSASSEDQVVSKAIQAQNRLRDLTLATQSDTTQGSHSFSTQARVKWTSDPERFYANATSSLTNRQTEIIIDTPTQATYIRSSANWIQTPAGTGSSKVATRRWKAWLAVPG